MCIRDRSIAQRSASVAMSKGREEVREHHRDGGKRMWTGEKGQKRRDAYEARKQQKRDALRATALPLPPNTKDRVHGGVYIVQVAKGRQRPGDLVKWHMVATKNGRSMTGILKWI